MVNSKKSSGYRLHKDRVLFSKREIIRTIRYPLFPYEKNNIQQQEFYKHFKQAIIRDDLVIRGDINLNDYLKYTNNNQTIYTLFDFWVDSLKAGVIWVSKTSEFSEIIPILYPNIISTIDKVWNNASELKKFFDKECFAKEFILKKELRKTKTRESLEKTLTTCLKDKTNKDSGADIINEILEGFFGKNKSLILTSEKDQDKFWKEHFNLDKSLIKEAKPKGEAGEITFFIIPELISLDNPLSIEDLVSKREKWLKEKVDEKKADNLLKKFLGLENNFNGFSNYFNKALKAFQKDKINIIFDTLLSINEDLVRENEIKIKNSLTFLSDQAKKLGEPSLPSVSNWAEYRSVFGGKLESWFTNFKKRKGDLKDQLTNLKESLDKAEKFLDNISSPLITQKEIDDLKFFSSKIKQFINENKIETDLDYQVFDSLLSFFRKQLNFLYQRYHSEADEPKDITDDKELKGVYEKIYKPVAFFGVSLRKKNKKIVEKTIPLIENGFEIIFKVLSYLADDFNPMSTFDQFKRKNDTEENNYRNLLQAIFKKIKLSAVNSPRFENKYKEVIENAVDDKKFLQSFAKKENLGKFAFLKSKYSKGTLTQIEVKTHINWLEAYYQLVLDLKDFAFQFGKQELLTDTKLLIDWIELCKNLFSHLIRFNNKESFSLENFNLENFESVKNYLKLTNENSLTNIKKNDFTFIIESLIFAEIKGAATILTKTNYLAKYTVQVIGSDNKFQLFYQPKDQQIDLKTIDLNKNTNRLMLPHQYLIAADKNKIKTNKKNDPNLIRLEKNNKVKESIDHSSFDYFFRLSSSPYQLQFLDKFIHKPKGWEEIEINLSEWGFIVEEEYEIKWDLQNKKPQFFLKENSQRNKFYLSIPFQIKAKGVDFKQSTPLKDIVEKRLDYPILGVDVGEYGLAYCLVRFKNEKPEVLTTGFIKDKNIAKIKDKFSLIQKKARRGIFNETDSSVSRVRENAIGHLRNKLHVILINDKASVVYEYQISNFETGSNRTIKIYNSVKRADVHLKTEADKQIHNHVWGITKYIGEHLSAYASSYTCSQCHRSLYQIKKDDLEKATISLYEGNILTIDTKKGKFYGYSQNERYKKNNIVLKNNEESLKEFKKLVRDFARPPISKNSEVLNFLIKKKGFSFEKDNQKNPDGFIDKFRAKRGNSALFVCPFVDCLYCADADIQAAFMMAIRGYLNFKGIVKINVDKDKKDDQVNNISVGDSFLEKSIEFLKDFVPGNLFFPSIELK